MKQKGPWSTDQIQRFLGDIRIPVRIACNGASGHPVLIERYLGDTDSKLASFLLARAEQETVIGIEPQTLVSWDYRERMGAAA